MDKQYYSLFKPYKVRKANFFIVLLLLFATLSCEKGSGGQNSNLPDSTGSINSIAVIVDDILWKGAVGDSLRTKLANTVQGLPDEEPSITLNQYAPKLFSDAVKCNRNIVVVSLGNEAEFKHVENEFAAPQNVYYFTGPNVQSILELLEVHGETLESSIKFYELIEMQKINAKQLLNDIKIQKRFGVNLQIPDAYDYVITKSSFYWLKKEIPTGNLSLLLYTVPKSAIENQQDVVSNVIRIRDSIGALYIQGIHPKSKMITEESYYPYLAEVHFEKGKAFETRGTWELTNDYMNGPFVNYAFKDLKSDNYLIVEGFVYNPTHMKRDYMFELEAIIKTIHFNSEK